MNILGIDYSLVSPAICIINTRDPIRIRDCGFAFIAQKRSQECFHAVDQGFIASHGLFNKDLKGHARYQRNLKMLDWAVMHYRPTKVFFEGYAFGAKGDAAYQLAENCGIAKHWLFERGIAVETIAPNTIKKHATGKGNADKNMMYEAWLKDGGVDLEKMLDGKAAKNPISDIVDSFYVARTGAWLLAS